MGKTPRHYEDKAYSDAKKRNYDPPHKSIFEGYSKKATEDKKAYSKGYKDGKKDRRD